MTASISGWRQRFCAAAVLAAAALWTVPAQSQDAPEQAPAPPPRPLQLLPDQLTEPAEPPDAVADIAVGVLAAPGRDRIGLVDAQNGGFLTTLWQGSDLETLRKILPQMPTRMVSPAQRRLAENLLLSAGVLPTATNSSEASVWLLETRIARLAAMGAWDDALAMIELVPPADVTETIRRLRADAYLIVGRTGEACGETQAALNRAHDIHWQKMQVFCHLESGQQSAADLGLSLLREQQIDDAAYFWAVDILRGNTAEPPMSLGTPAPLLLAMLRAAGVPAPDALIRSGDATTFGVLASMPQFDEDAGGTKRPAKELEELRRAAAEAHILLAEQAVAVGTLAPQRLREIYRDLSIDESAESPLEEVSAADVRGRVRLFQVALAQTVPTARAEVIARAFDLTRADMGGTGPSVSTIGLVYAPLLKGIAPSADMVWFSGTAARGLLAAGEFEAAREWLALARNMSRSSQEAASIADGLWPLERLLTPGAKGRLPGRAMDAWAATVSEDAAGLGREVFLNLFSAFGDPIAISDWQPVLDARRVMERGPSVAPHVWNGLTLAARDRRVGEAAAFALIAFGDEGPAFAAPETLAKTIETLMAVGREQDARALAVEAVLALGL